MNSASPETESVQFGLRTLGVLTAVCAVATLMLAPLWRELPLASRLNIFTLMGNGVIAFGLTAAVQAWRHRQWLDAVGGRLFDYRSAKVRERDEAKRRSWGYGSWLFTIIALIDVEIYLLIEAVYEFKLRFPSAPSIGPHCAIILFASAAAHLWVMRCSRHFAETRCDLRENGILRWGFRFVPWCEVAGYWRDEGNAATILWMPGGRALVVRTESEKSAALEAALVSRGIRRISGIG